MSAVDEAERKTKESTVITPSSGTLTLQEYVGRQVAQGVVVGVHYRLAASSSAQLLRSSKIHVCGSTKEPVLHSDHTMFESLC